MGLHVCRAYLNIKLMFQGKGNMFSDAKNNIILVDKNQESMTNTQKNSHSPLGSQSQDRVKGQVMYPEYVTCEIIKG